MANTTFSGPILAGGIKNTTGTTVGSDMKNTGYVLMSQTEKITQAYTRILEKYVQNYPEQYFWFHQRWKTKPKNSD